MKTIRGEALEPIKPFFQLAADQACKATCLRARCGSVIMNNGKVIGAGYNSPPLDDESQRHCDDTWDYSKKPKYDLTCCVHAEWRAAIDACKRNPDLLKGSTLYFMRVDDEGNFTDAGEPYCTTCSRFVMESGVSEFALWNKDEATLYPLPEYNERSYRFHHL